MTAPTPRRTTEALPAALPHPTDLRSHYLTMMIETINQSERAGEQIKKLEGHLRGRLDSEVAKGRTMLGARPQDMYDNYYSNDQEWKDLQAGRAGLERRATMYAAALTAMAQYRVQPVKINQ